MEIKNIFKNILENVSEEKFDELLNSKRIKIERIVSRGHSSPKDFWYDQEKNEWVMLLQGSAILLFKNDKEEIILKPGDYINIPASVKHRVEWTDPNQDTIWLVIFY